MDGGGGNWSAPLGCNLSEAYKFTAYTVVYSLVFILGLLGNGGALYIFCKLSVKNRLSTVFLIHLAASDLLFVLTLPMRIAYHLVESVVPRLGGDRQVEDASGLSILGLACRASTYFFYVSMYCSIFFLTALSVCRYLVLSGRVRLQNHRACRRARILCLGIWVFVVGGIASYVAAVTSGFRVQASGCFEPRGSESWKFLHSINLLVLVVGFVLPLTVVLLCYALMIRHILLQRAGQRQRDVALVCLVLAVFCVCFLPYHIQRTLHLHYMTHPQEVSCQLLAALLKSVVVTLCFASANSCLDPLIFLFVGHRFIPLMKSLVAQCQLRGSYAPPLSESLASTLCMPPPTHLLLVRAKEEPRLPRDFPCNTTFPLVSTEK